MKENILKQCVICGFARAVYSRVIYTEEEKEQLLNEVFG